MTNGNNISWNIARQVSRFRGFDVSIFREVIRLMIDETVSLVWTCLFYEYRGIVE